MIRSHARSTTYFFCLISKSISLKSVKGRDPCNEIRGFHLEEHAEKQGPSRVAFYVWTTTLGEILTLNNLRRHVILMDWCCMCNKNK
jgi:hypothetical protein